jgi:hypothetical protein
MKPIPIILLLIFSFFSSSAQSFLSEGKQWNVKETLNFGPTKTYAYTITGDSSVASITYKKLEVYDSTFQNWHLIGLLREDEKRVFFKQGELEEGLLYDFDLAQGDTVRVISLYCFEEQELVVTNVDTIENLGVNRKRWSFDQSFYEIWIENIGSNFGPVHTAYDRCIFDWYFDLLCAYGDDTLSYVNPDFESCWITTVGIYEDHSIENVKIYPNPIQKNDFIKIQSKNRIVEVNIFSSLGVNLLSIKNIGSNTAKFNANDLIPGIYLIVITLDNGIIVSKKIVKK